MGENWKRKEIIGISTLYLGDCMEIIPLLPEFDAVVTDPPYGIADKWKGGSGHGWGKARTEQAVRNEWDSKPLGPSEIDMLMNSGRSVIIWGGNYFPLPPSRCWLVWNKPERNFSLAEAELAWTNLDACVRVVDWRRSDQGRLHPTQKPVEVMAWSLGMVHKAKTILDPFMGSGTTGVAAAMVGKAFTGIELDEGYFDIACKRIEEAYKQPDMLVELAPPPEQLSFHQNEAREMIEDMGGLAPYDIAKIGEQE